MTQSFEKSVLNSKQLKEILSENGIYKVLYLNATMSVQEIVSKIIKIKRIASDQKYNFFRKM